MNTHTCPWCNHTYLITDKELPIETVRQAYQDHLNLGCRPTMGIVIYKICKLSLV